MGPRSTKKKKGNAKSRSQNHGNKNGPISSFTPRENDPTREWNFVQEAGPGCHIARKEHGDNSWVLEWELVDPNEFGEQEEVPDIAVDPDERTLSLCNLREDPVVAYVTVYDKRLLAKDRLPLQQGSTTDKEGQTRPCTTLIVLCPALTFVHLCYVDLEFATQPSPTTTRSSILDDLCIDSDVQVWNRHNKPDDEHMQSIDFPLQGGPFLCTQGEGGHLTHFFSGNQHAIDFRCAKGTPLLAVGDGVVVQVQDEHKQHTGIAVSNLFSWNSILLHLDPPEPPSKSTTYEGGDDTAKKASGDLNSMSPLFVEYVHIASASVRVGDRVSRGQIIGTSGGIGMLDDFNRGQMNTNQSLLRNHLCSDSLLLFIPSHCL